MTELADTSAWVVSRRDDQGELRERFSVALRAGRIAVCDMVRLELLESARNHGEFRDISAELSELPDCPIAKSEWRRALWVYEQLAAQGGAHQRSVEHSDLLIAAAAEAAETPIVHYDRDFERIAEITGQPTRWVVERGSI